MKAWWNGLALREQRMILVSGGILAVFLLYVLGWVPLQGARDRLAEQAEQQRETLRWMQQAATEIRQLSARAKGRSPATGQSLLGLIDQTARAQQVSDAVKRVQPDGTNSVRVWLENAAFDDLMRWLGILEQRHGVSIESLNVERGALEGRVTARLSLATP